MKDLRNLVKVEKIKLATLKIEDCEKNPKLKKFFWNNNKTLDRFHIPEISSERYSEIAKTFNRTAKFDEKNLKLETATDYYIRKARMMNVAEELGLSLNQIDFKDYCWDESWYTEHHLWWNAEVLDDAWRYAEEDTRYMSANKAYLDREPCATSLDMELFDNLYHFCYKAVVSRKAMLLGKVDKCLKFLISIIETTNGFSQNCTAGQMAGLEGYRKYFNDTLTDKETAEFINGTNDIAFFADYDLTRNDYIETYRSIINMLSRHNPEAFRKDMMLVEDKYIEDILEVEEEVLSGAYLTDVDEEDEASEEYALA